MVLSHFISTHHGAIWSFMSPRLLGGGRDAKVNVLLALEDLPVAEAVPSLKRFALRRADADMRSRAMACLSSVARIYPKFRPGLRAMFLKAARSRTPHLRSVGLSGLNEFQDSKYDSILLKSLNDPDPGIRAYSFVYEKTIAARKRLAASKKRHSRGGCGARN